MQPAEIRIDSLLSDNSLPVSDLATAQRAEAPGKAGAAVALVGPGRVGSALLERFAGDCPDLRLFAVANSARVLLAHQGLSPGDWQKGGGRASSRGARLAADFLHTVEAEDRIVIDASASADVAALHGHWLASGLKVVTANKWALSADGTGYRDLLSRPERYRAATTVGAGLPMLVSIARLKRVGEPPTRIEGVLSGTLSHLIAQVGAGQAFSEAVIEAHRSGLTEPDPRLDLNGVDVARKLVILARAAGLSLSLADVEVQSLLPPVLETVSLEAFFEHCQQLDPHFARLAEHAPGTGPALAVVGRIDRRGRASVGLTRIAADHPLATLAPGDNWLEIRTRCYDSQPLRISGPGAGVAVTALQLWADLIECTRPTLEQAA